MFEKSGRKVFKNMHFSVILIWVYNRERGTLSYFTMVLCSRVHDLCNKHSGFTVCPTSSCSNMPPNSKLWYLNYMTWISLQTSWTQERVVAQYHSEVVPPSLLYTFCTDWIDFFPIHASSFTCQWIWIYLHSYVFHQPSVLEVIHTPSQTSKHNTKDMNTHVGPHVCAWRVVPHAELSSKVWTCFLQRGVGS